MLLNIVCKQAKPGRASKPDLASSDIGELEEEDPKLAPCISFVLKSDIKVGKKERNYIIWKRRTTATALTSKESNRNAFLAGIS